MIQFSSNAALYVLYFIGFICLPMIVWVTIKRKGEGEPIFDLHTTNWIRGICASIIVVGHFSNHLSVPGLLKLYSPITGYAVSVFLALSGYALETRYRLDNTYLNGFVKKRLIRIYLPWVTTTVFLCIIYNIKNPREIISGLFLFKTIYRQDTNNWYIICILFYYILFYLAGKICIKTKHREHPIRLWIILSGSLGWICFCILNSLPAHWYNNGLCFVTGIFLSRIDIEKFNRITGSRKKTIFLSLSLLVISGALYIISQLVKSNVILSWATWDLGGVSFVLFTVFSCTLFGPKTQRNPLIFFGKASLEVFLLATGLILKYYSLFDANIVSPIISLAIVAIVSSVYYVLDSFLSKKLFST